MSIFGYMKAQSKSLMVQLPLAEYDRVTAMKDSLSMTWRAVLMDWYHLREQMEGGQ